jgi:hypothetical protein
MIALLAVGIFCLILGVIGIVLERGTHLSGLPFALRFAPVLIMGMGSGLITVFISTRGGTLIRDEMVMRVEFLSKKYSFDASLCFIMALGIVNFFYPLTLSISGLLFTLMMFMSSTFILFRHFLMRHGKAE